MAFTRPIGRLDIDRDALAECRELATTIADPLDDLARGATTVSVERACLRLIGLAAAVGEGPEGIPMVNLVVDRIRDMVGLERGALIPFFDLVESGCGDITAEAGRLARGETMPRWPDGIEFEFALERARREADAALDRIVAARSEREERIERVGEADKPWLYEIVATGNIFEDLPQAQAAAREGCDIVAVIRSTGQSLLDHVPHGPTTEGFAGTYATQENFRLMRAALDRVSEELGRYIRLTNYASGLCMPEIAALAALERLDMMLNDCMYGIIFRDINMQRTFIDQRFARMIHALAGIVINTGEDNYLTTADAVESAHTVLASQLLNERLALSAGIAEDYMGLGHAFEIDPERPDQIMLELAHAQLIRECFPKAPLKYMPPTKHMTGNVFQGFLYDGMFNLVAALTGQDIVLLGMMTEGVHTPFLSDRDLALENARYVIGGAGSLAGELRFEPGGLVSRRAATVLEETRQMLQKVAEIGMFAAIEAGMFADTVRTRDGGRGLDGVVEISSAYVNPVREQLAERVGVAA
ncbi:MAG: lysine 5,6-aminomutase subunit alpha [Actinomycetota bacterium]|nr:lysine 5,6-aminomutase subunit alpha [Actinomycetota bacterium]